MIEILKLLPNGDKIHSHWIDEEGNIIDENYGKTFFVNAIS